MSSYVDLPIFQRPERVRGDCLFERLLHRQASFLRLPLASVQMSAKFEHALARRFYSNCKRQRRRFVEQQDDAVERAAAGAAGEGQPKGIKQLTAGQMQLLF